MCEHKWEPSGGCQETPGCFDNGNGGLIYRSKCAKCGLIRRRGVDYTGCRPGNKFGRQYITELGVECDSRGKVILG